jgi:hypothetical protein
LPDHREGHVTKKLSALVVSVAALSAAAVAQQQVQNGKVERRQATSIERELAAVPGAEPAWIAWRVPLIEGRRDLCSWYSDDWYSVRGFLADHSQSPTGRPQITPPTGPVPLEAGTGLVTLVRVVDGRVERLRTLTDDCPIDAGGRAIHWLDGITPAESLKFLESLTRPMAASILDRVTGEARRSIGTSAVSAMALHHDAAAEAILTRITTTDPDTTLRRQAGTRLASRSIRGFEEVRKLVGSEQNDSLRRSWVTALGQTRFPATAETLLALAKSDRDATVRGDAIYYYASAGGPAGIANVIAIAQNDADDRVKTRAVQGLATLPDAERVDPLISLARTSTNAAVRKQAVTALSASRDPRAMAFIEAILKGNR